MFFNIKIILYLFIDNNIFNDVLNHKRIVDIITIKINEENVFISTIVLKLHNIRKLHHMFHLKRLKKY